MAGLVVAYLLGFINFLMEVDKTYLTSVIIVITLTASMVISVKGLKGSISEGLKTQLDFTAGILPSIGMVGTVIGLMIIIMDGIPEPSQLLIGVGTALTTTLMGLIGAVLLNQQLTILEVQTNDKT